jgi:hypothetical protein
VKLSLVIFQQDGVPFQQAAQKLDVLDGLQPVACEQQTRADDNGVSSLINLFDGADHTWYRPDLHIFHSRLKG